MTANGPLADVCLKRRENPLNFYWREKDEEKALQILRKSRSIQQKHIQTFNEPG